MFQENLNTWWKRLFLKSWHPTPTVNLTIVVFIISGLNYFFLLFFHSFFLFIFGIVITTQNAKKIEYHLECEDSSSFCVINFDLDDDLSSPVLVFYELTNFYQNHRRYIKSKSLQQLAGDAISSTDADSYCSPIVYNKDIYSDLKSWTGKTLDIDAVASPCGLIAKSFFNDSYELRTSNNTKIEIIETGITWPDDMGKKFKRGPNSEKTQWIDPLNEHFIVWMRTAGLPNFRKLWGRIQSDLPSGKYELTIINNYNVKSFGGTKSVILSTSGAFGGKNTFLGITYFVVAAICFCIATLFYAKKKITHGQFGAVIKED